jgi:hypothetical protein
MNDLDATTRGAAASYRCSSCSRRFIDFGETGPGEVLCSCGAALAPHAVPRGLYELGAAMSEESRVTTPGRAPVPKEPDQGYGASHGYDATHGGPSGPGDAPAEVPEKST